ncbi:hypothetical protein GO013_05665 [Pseudodesulfovibrio sp. JC047]|uniref:hypothetical protein n=1 Tax=Pseudodesulfovibrio sp. JC047 TaxID=2683199 RepID=UPI0013D5B6EB|nr:hypothetical protein [Pseudodesulfovibrio sp. JC047]NDV18906.1 hypothetical protein [Pseudodesulfovibrio sp. JC047]
MTRLLLSVCLAMVATLFLAAVSEAHKVNIFAYVEGNTVVTDSGYSRSKRVQGGVVEVRDGSTGKLLLSGTTDTTGRFDFEIPAEVRENQADLRLLLKAGAGHQAEWTVTYAEFSHTPGIFSDTTSDHVHTAVQVTSSSSQDVETLLRRELEPIKRMLAEMHDAGPSVTEILGGIGYIFGLFGVVAYMKSRK